MNAQVIRAPAQPTAVPVRTEEPLTFCALLVGGQLFGIDTSRIREVLGRRHVERVPLAPDYIAGIVTYRGDVLTAVSLRALLGQRRTAGADAGCVLVLEDDQALSEGHGHGSERFALLVDVVGGVVTVERGAIAPNPSTLDDIGQALFSGAVRTGDGLLVRLDPHRLNPARLARCGLFAAERGSRCGPEMKEN